MLHCLVYSSDSFFRFNQMPLLKGAASDVTRFQRLNAQTIVTTGPKTATYVPPVAVVAKSVVASVTKASDEAKKTTPATTVLATSALKTSTSKRG